ncbi:MAG: GPW/gp25 family protein [Bacteroidota bacterium]
MTENLDFLGTGWAFPPSFDIQSKTTDLVSGVEDINQSLGILLSTSLGERVMQPRFGCNLADYQFEPLNQGVIGFLKNLVEEALLLFEPRIVVEKVIVTPNDSLDLIEGRFTIEVQYLISSVNSRFNYVYDFYLREAEQSI